MFISFGHLTRKSLLFIVVPMVMVIHMVLIFLIIKEKQNEDKNNKNKLSIFFNCLLQFLGRSINGILWLLFERRTASTKIEKLDSKDNKDMKLVTADQNIPPQDNSEILCEDKLEKKSSIYNEYELDYYKKKEIEKKRNCKIIYLLILICVLDFCSVTCHSIIIKDGVYDKASGGFLLLSLVIKLFAIEILSKLIIKNTKIYRHHYLSIIIILIVAVSINVFFFDGNYKFSDLLEIILPELLYSVMYVFGGKYLLMTKGNIYKLLFINGVIGIILLILLQVVAYFIPPIKNLFCEDGNMLKSFGFEEFLTWYSIPLLLIIFFETWLSWLLIYYFSVNHFGAICSIQLFSICFIQNVDFKVYFIGSVIITFMTLVYNEIIILKFCGFDKNTTIEIDKRARRDSSCDFGKDDDEIFTRSNDNYIIMKGDIGEVND